MKIANVKGKGPHAHCGYGIFLRNGQLKDKREVREKKKVEDRRWTEMVQDRMQW